MAKILPILIALLMAFFTTSATAVMVSFDCISGNSMANCSTGESQLSIDVTDQGSNQVLFTFNNAGPLASSITDVYFDDRNSLLSIASLIDNDEGVGGDAGVDFSLGASPGNLPSANDADPDFVASMGLSADSDAPVQPNGVNPGETLGILLNIVAMQDFNKVITDLISGELRVGIHVQGFGDGGSESFVSTVPLPAAVWMLGAGLVGLITFGRKKNT